MKRAGLLGFLLFALISSVPTGYGSEADIVVPDLKAARFGNISGLTLLYIGLGVCALGAIFGLVQYAQTKNLPVHQRMREVSQTIWETCKTYLQQQGKFLAVLWALVAICMIYYFLVLQHETVPRLLLILVCSVLGILGSYGVAWFGIRINTVANSRGAFSSLRGRLLDTLIISLRSGMSVGLLLVSVELFFMICILAFFKDLAGPCFIGFAIGESLGASALRIAGGIFTKIADIGSDLMKIIFKLPEDDPKNPGVIADCTGDNAGDSVGPTADGFETYGVTGVALIVFLALALAAPELQPVCAQLLVWIFVMRILMILTSLVSYFVNLKLGDVLYGNRKDFNPEAPLTNLVWITSTISIAVTFVASYLMLGGMTDYPGLWWALAIIISCGTIAGALIPEFTKIFTSTHSKHVQEITNCSRHGGASLNILSGFVAGNFSGFWKGMVILLLMFISYKVATFEGSPVTKLLGIYDFAPPIFAFGLVAFGFLGMGPVTIAVDSFGPVSDNAQSIYELSQIEQQKDLKQDIQQNFGFEPDFENAKLLLEKADGAGNTFKATAKPVLIGTAVVGATTMVFSIIMLLEGKFGKVVEHLSLVQPEVIMGLLIGGAVIYWFTGASTQAVVTGAYRAVVYIKNHIKLDAARASVKDSKEVVRICTIYAQRGMINIFFVMFSMALALAFFDPYFFVGYLIGIAFFGLFQAVFMANAGGAWDNAKKIVEVDMREKGTALHAATVVGDTVGDPFKDTSSVSMNPVIKFTTLFGLLAVEIAVKMIENERAGTGSPLMRIIIGAVLFVIALVFVWRSFYAMRIPEESAEAVAPGADQPAKV